MAKFLLRCAEDVDIFHAAAVIAGSVMRIALEMSLMIRAFEQTHASRYNNLCVVSDAVCTTSLAWLQSLNVIIDDFTFVFYYKSSTKLFLPWDHHVDLDGLSLLLDTAPQFDRSV